MKFHNKALSLALFFLTSFARNPQHFASAVVPGDGQHNHSCEDQDWDTYVVGFKDRASHDAFLATGVQTAGLGVAELNAVVLQFDSEEEAKAWGAGKHDVEYVEKNGPVCATQTSSSAEQTPYGIDMVKSLQIPDYVANSGIKMCIIDSGYQRHEDLPNDQNGDPVTGKSGLCGSPCNWYDPISAHGNHVAGTIAAIGGNSKGVIGVVKNNKMPLHIVRVFENNSGSWASVANALLNCNQEGAHIASMSLGGGGTSAPSIIQNAVDTILANNDNFLMIAAAGNAGNGSYSWPASMPEMMSVASVTSSKARSGFSQYNDQVDIAAPGSNVLSTVFNNGYEYYSGTSMATPHVAGVAAKIWSHAPSLTAQEVRDILEATAEDRGAIGRDDEYGHGIVDAKAAYESLGPAPPSVSPSPSSLPSSSPSEWCEDSPAFFKVKPSQTWLRGCKWIADKRPALCNKWKFRNFCHKTCESCDLKCNNTGLVFYAKKDSEVEWTCKKLKNLNRKQRMARCANPKFYLSCPKVCKVSECFPPTAAPTPGPTACTRDAISPETDSCVKLTGTGLTRFVPISGTPDSKHMDLSCTSHEWEEVDLGFDFPFDGGVISRIALDSNGKIDLDLSGKDNKVCGGQPLGTHGYPRIAFGQGDIHPDYTGDVVLCKTPKSLTISFEETELYEETTINSQVQLFDDGRVRICFGSSGYAGNDNCIGYLVAGIEVTANEYYSLPGSPFNNVGEFSSWPEAGSCYEYVPGGSFSKL